MRSRTSWLVRDASTSDAARCAEIYAPYVLHTAVSFEEIPPTVSQMAARIVEKQRDHRWLVVADANRPHHIVGYAYGGPYAARAAYRWSAEVSVYLDQESHRAGAGTALYNALIPALTALGYRRALAGIALPHEASVRFHERFGFTSQATFPAVGWKFGAWHDVLWMARDLGDGDRLGPPAGEPGRHVI